MTESNALVSIEQKDVEFYDDVLTADRADNGKVYASLRHMCQALGIDVQGQRQRINRHTILDRGLMVCKLHTIQGEREHHVLRVDLVPLWLSGIRTKSVNEKVRPKLEKFQEEAATVLWEAFQDGRLTASPSLDDLVAAGGDAAEAYKIAEAILKLARHQLFIESRIDSHELRLEELEAKLSNDAHVSDAQAAQLSQAVKTVALILGKQTGRNEFGGVYGELYRRYNCSSYKLLPQKDFDNALNWLNEWKANLESHTF